MKLLSILFLILGLWIQGFCQFSNVTSKVGINHVHVHPQFMGGGAVFFDLDGDGWEDLYLTGGVVDDKLYLNDTDGGFIDVSERIPFQPGQTSSGVIAGDVNQDGCIDLFVTNYDNSAPNYLMINDCEGGFINESRLRGINDNGESIGAAFWDYDRDGDLDIYVGNYIQDIQFMRDSITNAVIGYDHNCQGNFLYQNDGSGSFTEIAEDLGIRGNGCTLAMLPFINESGDQVMYIANDYGAWIQANELFMYEPSLDTFKNVAADFNLDAAIYGMGIAIGDVGNDLDNDFYITNIGSNVFYENESGKFVDNADIHDVENRLAWGQLQSTSWGTFFFDLENDGDLDLFVANGFVPSANFNPTSPVDPNKLYVWTKDQTFEDKSEVFNLDFQGINRGCIYSDYDNDGDLDILIATLGAEGSTEQNLRFQFFKNEIETDNNFLKIKLQGIENNPDGFGSVAYVYTDDGKAYMRNLYSGGTHSSQNSSVLHFGLADANHIDSIKVTWPDQSTEFITDIPINKNILITEGTAEYMILGCTNDQSNFFEMDAQFDSYCESDLNTSTFETNHVDLNIQSDGKLLHINSDLNIDLNLRLVNLIGQSVSGIEKMQAYENIKTIDLSDLEDGIYFLLIEGHSVLLSKMVYRFGD